MGYIPPGARWYLADIVEEITVEGEPGNIVHINMVLVEAASPEEAYQRAIECGKEYEQAYKNSHGQNVVSAFLGLKNLNVIHGEPVHGTELIYSRHDDMSVEELAQFVPPKEELGVFAPIKPPGV